PPQRPDLLLPGDVAEVPPEGREVRVVLRPRPGIVEAGGDPLRGGARRLERGAQGGAFPVGGADHRRASRCAGARCAPGNVVAGRRLIPAPPPAAAPIARSPRRGQAGSASTVGLRRGAPRRRSVRARSGPPPAAGRASAAAGRWTSAAPPANRRPRGG